MFALPQLVQYFKKSCFIEEKNIKGKVSEVLLAVFVSKLMKLLWYVQNFDTLLFARTTRNINF
jgi:hypothetical protein